MTIEGRQSIRTVIDIKSDFETRERFVIPGAITTESGYHAEVAMMLKSVPRVMRVDPGSLNRAETPIHWLPDLRNL